MTTTAGTGSASYLMTMRKLVRYVITLTHDGALKIETKLSQLIFYAAAAATQQQQHTRV